MTPDFALFLSPEGIALGHRQTAGHWALLGDTALDVPDLPAALAKLREAAEARADKGFGTLLVLPDDQILYTSLTAPGPDEASRIAQIEAGLEGLTPYPVAELRYDWRLLEDGRVQLAVVAQETLDEAASFAREHGFEARGFGAHPSDNRFPGVPRFDGTAERDGVAFTFGPDTWKPPAPEVAAPAVPTPEPEAEAEAEEVAEAEALAAPAPTPPVPPEPATPAPKRPRREKGATPKAAESPAPEPGAKPLRMPRGFGARRGKAAATAVGKLVGARKPRFAVAPQADDANEARAPLSADASPPGDTRSGLSAPARGTVATGGARPARPVLSPETPSAAPTADTETPAAEPRRKSGLQGLRLNSFRRAEADKPKRDRPRAVKIEEPPTGVAEPDMPVMGGLLARKSAEASNRGGSLKLGLIMTLVLLIVLALIAVWAALYLPDSRIARWFTSDDPAVEVAADAPIAAENAIVSGLGRVPDSSGTSLARLTPEQQPPAAFSPSQPLLLPDIDADLDLGPAPVAPETLLPSESDTANFYARTGIWQRPPDFGTPSTFAALDDIYLASLDPVIVSHDAFALPMPNFRPSADIPLALLSPVAPGTQFTLDENGLVVPTAEGALTPDGILIIAGQPAVLPVPRNIDNAIAAGLNVTGALLASFQPRPRPDDLAERRERQVLGGVTMAELGTRRPTERPLSIQQLAEAEQAARAAEAAAQPGAEGVDLVEVSALAIASSRLPAIRPADFAAIVEQARTDEANEPETATVRAASFTPDIPTSASVSREATMENAIDLREINLIGVTGTPSNRRALVRLSSGRFVRVEVGDRLDGGQVAAIGEHSLQYVKRGRNITLEITDG